MFDRIKTAVVNYEATIRELNTYIARQDEGKLFEETDDLMLRILKVIFIHEMISTEELRIANTMQNIQFALHAVSDSEKLSWKIGFRHSVKQEFYTIIREIMN